MPQLPLTEGREGMLQHEGLLNPLGMVRCRSSSPRLLNTLPGLFAPRVEALLRPSWSRSGNAEAPDSSASA